MNHPRPDEPDLQDVFLEWLRYFQHEGRDLEKREREEIAEYRDKLAKTLAQQVDGLNEAKSNTAEGREWFMTHQQLAILRIEYEAGKSIALIEAFMFATQKFGYPPIWVLEAMHAGFASRYDRPLNGRSPKTLDKAFRVHASQGQHSPPMKQDNEFRRDGALCFEMLMLQTVIPSMTDVDAAKLVCARYTLSKEEGLPMIRAGTLSVRYSSTWKPRFERSASMKDIWQPVRQMSIDKHDKQALLNAYPGGCEIIEKYFPATTQKACLTCGKLFEARKGEFYCVTCRKKNASQDNDE